MKKQLNFVSLLALTALVGCNDDVGSRSTSQNPVKPAPPIEAEVIAQRSMLIREKGSDSLSTAKEIKKTLAGTLSVKSYRTVPLMEKDDEGSSKNTTTITSLGRPAVNCGTGTFAGIKARIADCVAKNTEKASWEGSLYGASGEGNWKLVSRSDDNKEIWIDETTGLLWSYLLSKEDEDTKTTFNWCKASGNGQGNTSSEQVDCLTTGAGESLCDRQTLDEVGTQAKWRLPTRNDYLQADLNGLRFVLAREPSELGLWTATMRSTATGRTEAWVYSSKEGTLSAGNLTSERYVRCIGVPKL